MDPVFSLSVDIKISEGTDRTENRENWFRFWSKLLIFINFFAKFEKKTG